MTRLFHYWRAARMEIVIGGIVLIVGVLVELLQPWPVKWLVDHVFGKQPPPPWVAKFLPALAGGNLGAGVAAVCVSILALAVVYRLATLVSQFFLIRAGARIVQQLRCVACEQLHRLSLAFHDRTKVGDSLYRVAYDAHAAQTLLNGALVPMFSGALVLVGAGAVMLRVNPLLTLVTLAIAPVFFIVIRVFGKRMDEHSKRYHESESALVASLQESLSSIRAVQAFTLEPEAAQRFRAQSEQSLESNERMTRAQLLFGASTGLAVSLGTAAVVWVASQQVMRGRLSVGDILLFLAYLGMLYQPMNIFSHSISVIQSARAQLRRVFEIIDALPDIKDRPGAKTLAKVRGAIEFRGVSFHYEAERSVLRGVSVSIEPGQALAIVGRTGAGKTTMASLLMRFYDPAAGGVFLDGHDIRDLQVAWLRRQVSVVLQEPVIFSTSVAENIGYGRPGASLEQIKEAARLAQADEFIRALPQGYDSVLGERGVNLSGGQRQRLSIARAFLKNAPILVLDEPTSALDARTEEALMAATQELMKGRTTLVIAHRLSTVRRADQIIVLDAGRIIERGRHEELLAGDTEYRKMCRSQWGDATGEKPESAASSPAAS